MNCFWLLFCSFNIFAFSVFSRFLFCAKWFYDNRSGFNGRECLLRLICEAADTPLGIHNGVFGDVLHIILTWVDAAVCCFELSSTVSSSLSIFVRRPSSSEREIIENEFYEAEIYGSHGKCDHYKANCPRSVFDFISVFEAVWRGCWHLGILSFDSSVKYRF